MPETQRRHIRITGTVQGVGFRPFIHGAATSLGLTGFVGNDDLGVFIEVEGDDKSIMELVRRLEQSPPPLSVVDTISISPRTPVGNVGFRVVESRDGGHHDVQVSVDAATCVPCMTEVRDPAATRSQPLSPRRRR